MNKDENKLICYRENEEWEKLEGHILDSTYPFLRTHYSLKILLKKI